LEEHPTGNSYSERDTHVTHTLMVKDEDPTDPATIFWEERRMDYRKIKLMLQGKYREPRTAWLSLRLPPTIRKLYSQAPDKVKLAARRALESVLIAWFLGESQVRITDSSPFSAPFIFNINLNMNENKAEARSENQNIVQNKLEILIDELNPKLEELAVLLKRVNQLLAALLAKKDEYKLLPLAEARLREASEKTRQAFFITKRIRELVEIN